MKNILFLGTGNSCRSQMAEGFARAFAPAGVRAFSAGTKPVGIHPRTILVMAEASIDLDSHTSKPLGAIPAGTIDTVVTLCGDAEETCPAFPGRVLRLHWDLPDPARAAGTEAEILAAFRSVRDGIRARVTDLLRVAAPHGPVPVLASERVYDGGRVVRVDRETIALLNGKTVDLEIIRHPGASAVVPLLPGGSVVLIRQYRHAAGGPIIEVPAGKLDPGETPEECARRECTEESGWRPGRLHRLGFIYTTPGFTDEVIHLFAATGLEPAPLAHEDDEVIDVFTVPLARALEMIASNEIRDGKTVCALVRTDQERRAGRI